MKRLILLPLLVAAACSDQPTKEESLRIFAATNTVTTTAQTNAVTVAKAGGSGSGELSLNYNGACLLGGSVAVTGSYVGDGTDERAAFDLSTTFDGCKDIQGTLDGELHWTSKADANGFSAAMTGGLDWSSGDDSASCDFDLYLAITSSSITYGGSLCGYAVTELGISGK